MKRHSLLIEIEAFLTRHLPHERNLTRATVLSYRDTLKLFLRFCAKGKYNGDPPFEISSVKYQTVLNFLADLESKRQCGVNTRNQRLAALKSFCSFLLLRRPEVSASVSRVLAIPFKKCARKVRHYLDEEEINVFISCCSGPNWVNKRNTIMFDFAVQTGLRVAELTNLKLDAIVSSGDPFVKVSGKGRKERAVPLNKPLAGKLDVWIEQLRKKNCTYVFPTIQRTQMSSDAVQFTMRNIMEAARKKKRSLRSKHITVHSLRHTAAMRMLNRGVDIYIIALWLGHEKIETTQLYLSESLSLKKKALKRLPMKDFIPTKVSRNSPLDFMDDI